MGSAQPTETELTKDILEQHDAFAELGTLGLDIQGGRILDDVLPNLKEGRDRAKVYRQMMSDDATIGAMLFAISMLVRQVQWDVTPATPDSEADLRNKEFLEECMKDMSYTWDATLSMVLSMLGFGYSVIEEVYKKRGGPTDDPATTSTFDDGRIGWRKLAPRAQETIDSWHFDPNSGEMVGVTQVGPPDYQTREIPASRFLLFNAIHARGNPEGQSLLRTAYKPWYFKGRIERIEGIGVERDLAGLPMMRVPARILQPNASAADKLLYAECQKIIRNVRRDDKEGVILPGGVDKDGNLQFEFSLLSTGGRRQFDTSEIITRWDRRIAQTVLAQFILLGQSSAGSFALAESQTDLFAVAIGAILEAIQDVFNRTAIPRLFRMNTLDTTNGFPELVPGDIETIDPKELAEYIATLTTAGVIRPDDDLEREMRERVGLPPPIEPRPSPITDPEPPEPPDPSGDPEPGSGAPVAQGEGEVPGGGDVPPS